MGRTNLSLSAVTILHAIANGGRFGFDIMATTGLRSGTVYPTLDRLEQQGFLRSHWEDEGSARAENRPARRYFALTAEGAAALETALDRLRALGPVRIDPSRLVPKRR